MIKYYYSYRENNKHDTMINNIIFNSDYDCIKCNKTNPVTEPTCIKCGYRNIRMLKLLDKFYQINNKIKLLKNKSFLVNSLFEDLPIVHKIIMFYPDISTKNFKYILENYEEVITKLDFMLLKLI